MVQVCQNFYFFISFNKEQRSDLTHLGVWLLGKVPKKVSLKLSVTDEDRMACQWFESVKQVVRQKRCYVFIRCAKQNRGESCASGSGTPGKEFAYYPERYLGAVRRWKVVVCFVFFSKSFQVNDPDFGVFVEEEENLQNLGVISK